MEGNLFKFIESIETWDKAEDFTKGSQDLFYYYNNEPKARLDLKDCLNIIEKVFSCQFFLSSLKEYIGYKNQNFDDPVFFEIASRLRIILEFIFLSPTLILAEFDYQSVEAFRLKFKNLLHQLNSDRRSFDYSDLFTFLINNKRLVSKYWVMSNIDLAAYSKIKVLSFRLIKIICINLSYSHFLENKFKEIKRNKKDIEKFSWRVACSKIYSGLERRDSILAGSLHESNQALERFNVLFKDKNTEVSVYIIKKFLTNFDCVESDLDSNGIVAKVLENSTKIQLDIAEFCHQHLSAYTGKTDGKSNEWSNKIFLITNKTLATFTAIKMAADISWITGAFIFELHKWIDDVHHILNKYEIEDDWSQIHQYLKEENNLVEWKSSFLTSIESVFEGDAKEIEMSKKIMTLVAEAILGMINTEGGVILVGVVENPEKIKRQDVIAASLRKNGITFFDIKYEFERRGVLGTDDIKRRLQDYLFKLTSASHEIFNNLWSIEPITIKDGDRQVTVYKITVFQARKLVFSYDNEKQSIQLLKRANGRTIKASPLNILQKAGLAM